ncbi:MAG: hypothetical protein FJ161_03645, partial [Gammaproteobacteria bacterium]|nr:hypothetical protein [Gammaproteobacteria bacterium]
QEAAQRGDQNAVPTNVHDIAFAGSRSRTSRYLQQHFPATKKPGLIEKLEEFVSASLKNPAVLKELEIAELSRDKERLEEFKKGKLSKYTPPQSIEQILEDFARYIPHLKSVYSTNTTFAWDILESLFNRMDSLENPKEKEAARYTLIRALDDARAAYDLLEKKYVDNTDFTCQKGLEERLLDHHQMIVPDVKSNLNSNEEAVQILMSPFAKMDSQDIENGGIERHIYTPLLYQLYAQAAGYHFEQQTKQIYTLKDDDVDIGILGKTYLIQFENAKLKESQSQEFHRIIRQLDINNGENSISSLGVIEVDAYSKNPIITFLNKEKALEQQEHTETELIAPETLKTEEEILNTMVAEGPFIDRAHLEAVLAWHDPKASIETMQKSLLAGLEPNFTEVIPPKASMIAAYDSYVQNQLHLHSSCRFDFMHQTLEGILMQNNLEDLPCTQAVLCEYLLENPTALTQSKKGPLAILCAKQGFGKALSILIQNNAPLDLQNQYGNTALIYAAYNDHTDIVTALITAGANPNLSNQGGNTALIYAAQNGHTAIVQSLIDKGANLNLQNKNGDTALILAAYNDHIVTALITAGANPNLSNQYGNTALIYAAQNGHTAIVQALLDKGADPNIKNQYGDTALIWASKKGRTDIVTALIKAGANLHLSNKDGDTALIWASKKGHTDIVKALIKAGAIFNLQNQYGDTALMWAAKNGHTAIVEAIIEEKNGTEDLKYSDSTTSAQTLITEKDLDSLEERMQKCLKLSQKIINEINRANQKLDIKSLEPAQKRHESIELIIALITCIKNAEQSKKQPTKKAYALLNNLLKRLEKQMVAPGIEDIRTIQEYITSAQIGKNERKIIQERMDHLMQLNAREELKQISHLNKTQYKNAYPKACERITKYNTGLVEYVNNLSIEHPNLKIETINNDELFYSTEKLISDTQSQLSGSIIDVLYQLLLRLFSSLKTVRDIRIDRNYKALGSQINPKEFNDQGTHNPFAILWEEKIKEKIPYYMNSIPSAPLEDPSAINVTPSVLLSHPEYEQDLNELNKLYTLLGPREWSRLLCTYNWSRLRLSDQKNPNIKMLSDCINKCATCTNSMDFSEVINKLNEPQNTAPDDIRDATKLTAVLCEISGLTPANCDDALVRIRNNIMEYAKEPTCDQNCYDLCVSAYLHAVNFYHKEKSDDAYISLIKDVTYPQKNIVEPVSADRSPLTFTSLTTPVESDYAPSHTSSKRVGLHIH